VPVEGGGGGAAAPKAPCDRPGMTSRRGEIFNVDKDSGQRFVITECPMTPDVSRVVPNRDTSKILQLEADSEARVGGGAIGLNAVLRLH